MWSVLLLKEPEKANYKPGFFPRNFHYKRDAKMLVAEIRSKGGDAFIVPKQKDKSVSESKG